MFDDEYPICPICGQECSFLYFDKNDDVCGCDNCVEVRDAWEYLEAQITETKAAYGDMLYDMMKGK